MPTLSSLARQVKRRLLGSYREEVSTLVATITDTQSTLTLTSAPSTIAVGSVLSIDTEMFYVTGWDPGTKIATVARGYLSDAAIHNLNAIVEVNSRFPSATVYDAMLDQVNALPLGIFAVTDTGYLATTAGGQYLVDITGATGIAEGDIYGILDAFVDKPDQSQSWAVSMASATQAIRWAQLTDTRIVRMKYPTNADPSKFLVRLGRGPGVQWDAVNLNFRLMTKPIVSVFTPATTLATIGLPDSLGMPIVLGTMIELWGDQEVKRTARGPMGESRRPEEIPAGLLMSDITGMRTVYDRLISEEAAKLRAKYPFRWTS